MPRNVRARQADRQEGRTDGRSADGRRGEEPQRRGRAQPLGGSWRLRPLPPPRPRPRREEGGRDLPVSARARPLAPPPTPQEICGGGGRSRRSGGRLAPALPQRDRGSGADARLRRGSRALPVSNFALPGALGARSRSGRASGAGGVWGVGRRGAREAAEAGGRGVLRALLARPGCGDTGSAEESAGLPGAGGGGRPRF
ncbi:unnamed protein product [Rangifer tarandus platyrhynchus]|uniref:Uncharacterized protein n=1 Tax=Rangifer tarandus platyrhynchus TaxID=3082113 RepID=A0ABN8ZXG0_RANTA|nr:unnamed protein product [Rangifer tarandus platyrhynchus]